MLTSPSTRILLITGSHPDTELDIDVFLAMYPCILPDFMAVGVDAMGKHGWPLSYVVTYHVNDLAEIMQSKHRSFKIISYKAYPGVDIVHSYHGPTGSSALLGALAAFNLGYRKIVLCGCPLQGRNKHGRDYFKQFSPGWIAQAEQVRPYVRSMSGWTMEFLGFPEPEWVNGCS